MTFVNEYVSEADIEKYGLKQLCDHHGIVRGRYDWTVDKARDIYLMWIRSGREDSCHEQYFAFYWKGTFSNVLITRAGTSVRNGIGSAHWSLLRLDIPDELRESRAAILEDLKQALIAYREWGVRSTSTTFEVSFDF